MKISININEAVADTEVNISCNQLTPEIEKIIATLRILNQQLMVQKEEERLFECGFFRVSKSCLVHLRYVKSLKNDIDRKLRLTLENGEQIMVSRQYVEEIKRRLGVIS